MSNYVDITTQNDPNMLCFIKAIVFQNYGININLSIEHVIGLL